MRNHSKLCMAMALAGALAATSLYGADYWWMGASQKQGVFKSFDDVGNWRLGSSSGEVPSLPPGESDCILIGDRTSNGYRKNFDLNGSVHAISGWAWTDNWQEHYTSMTNGTLRILDSISNRRETFDVYSDATFELTATSTGTLGDSQTTSQFNVREGGTLKMYGDYSFRQVGISVMQGGSATIDPVAISFNSSATEDQEIVNDGELGLPNGFTISGYAKWNYDVNLYLRQRAGEMWIGGDVVRAHNSTSMFGSLRFEVLGGEVHFGCTPSFERANPAIASNTTAAFDVADSCALDLDLFQIGENVALTKKGLGVLRYGTVRPGSLTVAGGTLRLESPLGLDDDVTFSGGTTLEFAVGCSTVATIGNYANVSFALDPAIATAGRKILTSADDGLLQHVADELSEGLPAGLTAKVVSGSVVLSADSDLTFTYNGELSLSDPAAWQLGVVPSAGSTVTVRGATTVAVIDSSVPAFAKIIVVDGATLKASGSVELPPVDLMFDARVLVPGEASAVITNGVASSAQLGQIPVIEVETNAVANFGSSIVLKNVDLRLFGTIRATNEFTFGWAQAGETSFLEMLCDGATFDIPTRTVRNFVCPESGGCVRIPSGRLVYRNSTTKTVKKDDFHCGNIGYRNPSSVPFVFEISGCKLDFGFEPSHVGGAANVLCVDGGSFGKFEGNTHPGLGSWIQFLDSAKLTIGEGGQFLYSRGKNTLENLAFMTTVAGTEQIVLRDGGAIAMHVYNGNASSKAVVHVENLGYWDIPQLVKPNSDLPDVTDTRVWLSNLFNKFQEVNIDEGGTLYLRSASKLWGDEWDRDMVVADVPVTGAGDLCVTNDTPGHSLRVTMTSGRNTCTGSISAAASADGTELLFADGANWAGEVMADANVAFTNLTSSAPCTVNFGSLRLNGDYTIRAWKDGNTFTNDMVSVESGITGQGRILVQPMNDFEFVPGDRLLLGSCPSSAEIAVVPGGKSRWKLVKRATSDDPDVCKVELVNAPDGLILVVR